MKYPDVVRGGGDADGIVSGFSAVSAVSAGLLLLLLLLLNSRQTPPDRPAWRGRGSQLAIRSLTIRENQPPVCSGSAAGMLLFARKTSVT